MRIVTIEFGRLDQTHDRGGPLAGAFTSGKQPVLAPGAIGGSRFSIQLLSIGICRRIQVARQRPKRFRQ